MASAADPPIGRPTDRSGVRAVTLVVLLLVASSGCLSAVGGPDALGGGASPTGVPSAAPPNGTDVTVTEVVDGDTVDVRYGDGSRDTVRLLGVDTPEVHVETDPAEYAGVPNTTAGRRCLRRAGENASAFGRDRLAGETVTLEFDPHSERRGYYDRLLAYVYVGNQSFNLALLRRGHARVYDTAFTERERYEYVVFRNEGDEPLILSDTSL